VVFSQRKMAQTETPELFKSVLYGMSNLFFYFALQVYGSTSKKHAIRIVQAFTFVILLSFFLYSIGLIFPSQIFKLRHLLYSNTYDQMVRLGLAGSSVLFWNAGLAPALYIFGYQVACGAALALAFFLTARRNRIVLGMFTLLSFAIVIIVAERSVLPALFCGLVSVLFLQKKAVLLNIKKIAVQIVILFVASAVVSMVVEEYFSGEQVQVVQERIGSDDVWVRLKMQLAALEITAKHPFGLVAEGMAEEDWGRLAVRLGYKVVYDANQIDYALVHSSYLRFAMYLGWGAGVLIVAVGVYLLRIIARIRRFVQKSQPNDRDLARYGVITVAAFVSVFVQAMFHNDSFFTYERSSVVALCALIVMHQHIVRISGRN
jgi:hypothetical protein